MRLRHLAALVAGVVILGGVGVLVYRSIIPGLSSARREPPAAEVSVATWLLHESVPADARAQINPLGKDPAGIAAGQDLFRQKCAVCHAYDGSGKTEIGAGEYPRPPANDTCIQCHSQGRPLKNPIEGKYYDWPV